MSKKLTVVFEDDLHAAFKRLAKSQNRSISGHLIHLAQQALLQQSPDESTAPLRPGRIDHAACKPA